MSEPGNLIWITGLSGAGKTTIAKGVFAELRKTRDNVVLIDGDMFRAIMGNDLKYDPADRKLNGLRIARMCGYLVQQGLHVVCSTVSLYREVHQLNRQNAKKYYEIFIQVSMEELIRRDQKGIYSSAMLSAEKGPHVVGLNLPYDAPESPHLIIDNDQALNLDEKVRQILQTVKF